MLINKIKPLLFITSAVCRFRSIWASDWWISWSWDEIFGAQKREENKIVFTKISDKHLFWIFLSDAIAGNNDSGSFSKRIIIAGKEISLQSKLNWWNNGKNVYLNMKRKTNISSMKVIFIMLRSWIARILRSRTISWEL